MKYLKLALVAAFAASSVSIASNGSAKAAVVINTVPRTGVILRDRRFHHPYVMGRVYGPGYRVNTWRLHRIHRGPLVRVY